MLINTDLKLSLCCVRCGKTDVHKFSLFSLSGGWTARFKCQCGNDKFLLTRDKVNKAYWLAIICPSCEEPHSFKFTFKEFFTEQLHMLYCRKTGLEISFLGWGEKLQEKLAQGNGEDLAKELNCTDYFINPEVIFKCLDYLHDLMRRGRISCQCGNEKLEVEVFPEKIELACPRCHSLGMVAAEVEEDYLRLQTIEQIEMAENSFKHLNFAKAVRSTNSQKMD
ncbi:MAG TPA: hypothetical protein GXX38_01870 [Clostridia bacterium]|nr:hypothetical protein [Clostridia bacterium]